MSDREQTYANDEREKMLWLLYVIECKTPQHVYVGITTEPEKRWKSHKTRKGAFFTRHYGVKRFHGVRILDSGPEAREAERKMVVTLKRKGYQAAGSVWCWVDVTKKHKIKKKWLPLLLKDEPLFTWT